MFHLEVQPNLSGAEKPKENSGEKDKKLADYAFKQGLIRVVNELKEVQEKSEDPFFKKINIDDLDPEALMVLNTSIETSGRPFSKEVIENAFNIVKESPMYFNKVTFDDSEDRINYIKELISLYPNTFFKKSE